MCVYKCIVEYIPSFIRMQVQICSTCRTHSTLCRNRAQSDCIVCVCILLYDKLLCNKRIHRCFDALDYAYFFEAQHTAIDGSSILQDTATHCNTLHHTASHCITLHHTSHCNAQRYGIPWDNTTPAQNGTRRRRPMGSLILCAAVCGSVMQCVAVCCSVLQCVAVAKAHVMSSLAGLSFCKSATDSQVALLGEEKRDNCRINMPWVFATATHCNTPQHTATHCNTLQLIHQRLFWGSTCKHKPTNVCST